MNRWAAFLLTIVLLAAPVVSGQVQPDPPFRMNPRLYDPFTDARKEIAEALSAARRDHKRVLLVFGGNWCLDCHVLEYRFHQNAIRPLVESNFHLVHVDVGRYDN